MAELEEFYKDMERQQVEADHLINIGSHDLCRNCREVVEMKELNRNFGFCDECKQRGYND